MSAVPRWFLLLSLACAALCTAVYAQSLLNGFVDWDDGLLIFDNPIVRGPTPANIARAFTSYDPELYIPLTFLSYQLNYAVAGLEPWIYHLTNLLLHIGNAILVGLLAFQLSRRRWVAAACALLFALHPLHTEAVAWASSRKDVLSGFFFLLSFVSFLHYRATEQRKWHAWSIVAFALALLAKVTIIALPVLLLLHDWRERRLSRKSFFDVAPHLLLSVAFGVIALFGKQGNASLLLEKILIGSKAAAFYLGKLFVPTGFSVLYPYTRPIALGNTDLLLALSLMVVLSIGVVVAARRWRMPLFCWAWYLLLLAPTFTNFAKGKDILRDVYFASDRYAYLASIGVLLLVALLLNAALPRVKTIFLVLLLAAAGTLSYRQSLVWRDTASLFSQVLRYYPDAHLAHSNLGALHLRRGDLEGAARSFAASLEVRPNSAAYFNLGQMYLQLNIADRAEEMYRLAAEQNPADREALTNLGVLRLRRGDRTGARQALERAVEVDGSFAPAHFNLGVLLEQEGERAAAVEQYRRAWEIDPFNQEEARKRLEGLESGNR